MEYQKQYRITKIVQNNFFLSSRPVNILKIKKVTSNSQLIQQQVHNPVIVSIISSTAVKTDVTSGGYKR